MMFMETEVMEQAKPMMKAPECPSALAAFFPRGPTPSSHRKCCRIGDLTDTPGVRSEPYCSTARTSHVSKIERGKFSVSFGTTKMCGCEKFTCRNNHSIKLGTKKRGVEETAYFIGTFKTSMFQVRGNWIFCKARN